MTFLIIIFGILSDTLLSVLVGLVGSRRNIGFGWSFVLSLIFTPLIGLLITLISDERSGSREKKFGCIGTILGILGGVFLILFVLGILGVFAALV
jgi:energy-converting hydrogenase Eha subunit A